MSEQPEVAPVELSELAGRDDAASSSNNVGLLRDVEMAVTVELGRTTLRVRELLALREGSSRKVSTRRSCAWSSACAKWIAATGRSRKRCWRRIKLRWAWRSRAPLHD